MKKIFHLSLKMISSIALISFTLLSFGLTVLADEPATRGDTVSVYYNLSLPGEPVFETHYNGTPLSFVLGSGAMIQGFDNAVTGMIPGETKTVILSPDEAYGYRNESLVRVVPLVNAVEMLNSFNKSNIIISLIPGYPGPIIEYVPQNGSRERYVFTNITNDSVTVDTNRPLAGNSLQFVITLLDIKKNPE